jgi:hypothetical protein
MNETTNLGAAGPALVVYGKDGSAPGPTPASNATRDQGDAKEQFQQAYGQAVVQVRDFAAEKSCGIAGGCGWSGARAQSDCRATVAEARQPPSGTGGRFFGYRLRNMSEGLVDEIRPGKADPAPCFDRVHG